MKRSLQSYVYLFLVAGTVIAVDQWTKWLVRSHLPVGADWSPWPWLTPYARILHVYNTGVSFGMFQNLGPLFTVLIACVAAAIIYYFPRVPASDWTLRLALGLLLGGALGNLIDRVTLGHVTDFIYVGNFAVFNIADACINVGVAVFLLGLWLQDRNKKKTPPGTGEE